MELGALEAPEAREEAEPDEIIDIDEVETVLDPAAGMEVVEEVAEEDMAEEDTVEVMAAVELVVVDAIAAEVEEEADA